MPDDSAKSPRFPYVGALLCIACVGAAGWTWMRFSYAWDVPLYELSEESHAGHFIRSRLAAHVQRDDLWPQTSEYVSVRFTDPGGSFPCPKGRMLWNVLRPPDSGQIPGPDLLRETGVWVVTDSVLAEHTPIQLEGRCRRFELAALFHRGDAISIAIDTTASRFHPASIAGLVVGAMGVFVFSAALRHWLGERRRFLEKDEGA